MKKILVITLSLSEKNGNGRYSYSILKRLDSLYEFVVFSTKEDLGNRLDGFNNSEFNLILPKVYNFNGLRFFLLLWLIWKISKQARKADLVHAMMDYPYCFLAAIVAKLSGKPLIITAHGTYSIKPFNNFWDKIAISFSFRTAKKIICVSSYMQKEIKKRIKLNNTLVINNGIDIAEWVVEEKKVGEAENDFYPKILSVGALKLRKGHHLSLRAMAEVKKLYPRFKYYIIGDNSDKKYLDLLNAIIKKYELGSSVEILGDVSDQMLKKYYRDVDIFLLTPINITDNVEGFGLVYLEAAVFGKPAIGSWGSGAEDAIVDGQTGILVEPKKISNISDAVLKLAKDVNLRQEFGQNAQRRAMKYSWENMVKKYLDVYQQL